MNIRVVWAVDHEADQYKDELCQYQETIEHERCLLPIDHVRHRANRHDHMWRIYLSE